MAGEDAIKYSDIIKPDGSITNLISQLRELNATYADVVRTIQAGAQQVARSIDSATGATSKGRAAIDASALAADRLERAYKDMAVAMSSTGNTIQQLRTLTATMNKQHSDQAKYLQTASTSYDRYKADLKEATALYKSLTEAERADSQMGQELLNTILSLTSQIQALDKSMKPHLQTLTETQKAQERLNFLMSAEGQQLLSLRERISQVTAEHRRESAEKRALVEEQRKLTRARSEENIQLASLKQQTSEANRIAKLTAQLNNSAIGSYNRLAAQYELNKIELNAMSAEQRNATATGRALEEETRNIYARMIQLQEATGRYNLSVGNYSKAFDGLGFSVAQVVRELPALTVGWNTFFLGISNNIPMLVDQINLVRAQNAAIREQNKVLAANGMAQQSYISVGRRLLRSLLSWNTILVVALTLLSTFGKEIINFVKDLFSAEKGIMSFSKALKNIVAEVKDTNDSFGENMVLLKNLEYEYSKLTTTAQKTKFIEDAADEFDRLGLSIQSVSDAEKLFAEGTNDVVAALQQRAWNAAAQNLAAQKFEEALQHRVEAMRIEEDSEYRLPVAIISRDKEQAHTKAFNEMYRRVQTGEVEAGSELYKRQLEALTARYEAFYNVMSRNAQAAAEYEKAMRAEEEAMQYFNAGPGADFSNRDSERGGSSSRTLIDFVNRGRDPWEYIQNMRIAVTSKNEESLTAIINNEYDKRVKAARDAYNNELMELQKYADKNKRILTDDIDMFRPLTDDELNTLDTLKKRLDSLEKGSAEYVKAEKEYIKAYNTIYDAALREDKGVYRTLTEEEESALRDAQDIINEAIINGQRQLTEELEDIERERSIRLMEIRKANLQNQLSQLKEGSRDAAAVQKQIVDIDTGISLLENSALAPELQVDSNAIKRSADIQKFQIDKASAISELTDTEEQINALLELAIEGTQEELALQETLSELQMQIALWNNMPLPGMTTVNPEYIKNAFARGQRLRRGRYESGMFNAEQSDAAALFNIRGATSRQQSVFDLEQLGNSLLFQLQQAALGQIELSDAQWQELASQFDVLRERQKFETGFRGAMGSIAEHGWGGSILDFMGFNEDSINAFSNATDIVISNLQDIIATYVEVAEAAVAAAEERVEAAQSAYDTEVEARNNGYANNVATMKAELQAEQRNLAQKEQLLAEAQRMQEIANTAIQTSSLITATAQLLSVYSSIPFVGQALAAVAIAALWSTFAAAKIKAAQVTRQSDTYGEGGLEILQGGSHASGNDIPLGTVNHRGKEMRAEGGEALAIINKRRTAQYRRMLPSIIGSLNDGTFTEKYAQVFKQGSDMSVLIKEEHNADLSRIEKGIKALVDRDEKIYTLPDGRVIIESKNVKRIIKN